MQQGIDALTEWNNLVLPPMVLSSNTAVWRKFRRFVSRFLLYLPQRPPDKVLHLHAFTCLLCITLSRTIGAGKNFLGLNDMWEILVIFRTNNMLRSCHVAIDCIL